MLVSQFALKKCLVTKQLLKCHAKKSRRKKKQREDKKLYDCEIVEVDVANSRFKLHFVGYPDSDDQWQNFTEDELPVLRRIKPFEFSRETLEERTEAFKRVSALSHLPFPEYIIYILYIIRTSSTR